MAVRQSISSSPLPKHLLTHLTDRLARGCGCCCGCSRFERTLLHWSRTLGTRRGTSNRVTYPRSMWSSFLWIRALLFRRSPFRRVRDFINGLSRLWTDLMDHLSRAFPRSWRPYSARLRRAYFIVLLKWFWITLVETPAWKQRAYTESRTLQRDDGLRVLATRYEFGFTLCMSERLNPEVSRKPEARWFNPTFGFN